MLASPELGDGRVLDHATEPRSVVRLALPSDEDAIFAMLLAFEAECNSFNIEYDEERTRETIKLGVANGGGGFHGVIDGKAREIAGSIGIVFARHWSAKNYHLEVRWLYVRPEYRRSTGYGDKLMNWARAYRDALRQDKHIDLIDMPFSRIRLDSKLRWWRRWGEQIGGIFIVR